MNRIYIIEYQGFNTSSFVKENKNFKLEENCFLRRIFRNKRKLKNP